MQKNVLQSIQPNQATRKFLFKVYKRAVFVKGNNQR